MISHHVTCHVTAVMCLFLVKRKRKSKSKEKNIKSRKIDKRKRKMLVSRHIIIRRSREIRIGAMIIEVSVSPLIL